MIYVSRYSHRFKTLVGCCVCMWVIQMPRRVYIYPFGIRKCMYIHTRIYIYIHTYICTYIFTYVCAHSKTQCLKPMCTYICMYECTYLYIYMYVCMTVYMYVCIYIYVYYIDKYTTDEASESPASIYDN